MLGERLVVLLMLVLMTVTAYAAVEYSETEREPVEEAGAEPMASVPLPPDIQTPEPVEVPNHEDVYTDAALKLTGDLSSCLFIDSTVEVDGEGGITISGCEFVNSNIVVKDAGDVYVRGNIFRDNYRYDIPCVGVYGAEAAIIDGNEFVDVTTGVLMAGVADGQVINNLFYDCFGGYALVIGGAVEYQVDHVNAYNNHFSYNYPGAIRVSNPGEHTGMVTDIHHNLIEYSYENGIAYYDCRGAEGISSFHHNRVTRNGWSGLSAGGNSWGANLMVEENYFDNNGLLNSGIIDHEGRPTELYPVHPAWTGYCAPGPKHGVHLYDSSGVHLRGNVMANNFGSGVDISNSQGIVLEENIISGNTDGISVEEYDHDSVDPAYADYTPERCEGACLMVRDNYLFGNEEADWSPADTSLYVMEF